MMTDLKLKTSPATPGPNILSAGFHSAEFDLPQETVVIANASADHAVAIYAPDAARMGGTLLPPHSFIQLWPQFRTAYIREPTSVNGRVIQASSYFVVDGNGRLARYLVGEQTKISDSLTVGAGSLIGIVADRLFRVDLSHDTTYGGIPVAGNTTICLLPDGAANLLLPKDTTIAGETFPAGSTVVLNPGGSMVQYAFVRKPA
jgi:hypothetical protein